MNSFHDHPIDVSGAIVILEKPRSFEAIFTILHIYQG